MARNKEINIRVSESELEKIKENAVGNVANFMRELALGNSAPVAKIKIPTATFQTADPKLLSQISVIGGLLNQAMRVANTQLKSGKPLDAARLSLRIEATNKLLSELKNVS